MTMTGAQPRRVSLRNRLRYEIAYGLQHFVSDSPRLEGATGSAHGRIVEELRRGGPRRTIPVERRDDLTPAEFRSRYLRSGTPVVIAGGAASWPATQRWTFEGLRSRFGDATVKLVQRDGLTDEDAPADAEFSEELPFGEFLDGVLSGSGKYMRFSPLLEQFPELLEDLDHDFFRRMTRSPLGQTYQMFIGGDGTLTPFHNAVTPFLFLNVAGRKQWILVPVEYSAVLAPEPDAHEYNHSGVDVALSSTEEFPGLECVDHYSVITEPGDLLFVPSWMWHSVRNMGPTIGLRCGFMYLPGLVRESMSSTLLRVLAGELSVVKWWYYSFVKTDLPNRREFLVTPKWIRSGRRGRTQAARRGGS